MVSTGERLKTEIAEVINYLKTKGKTIADAANLLRTVKTPDDFGRENWEATTSWAASELFCLLELYGGLFQKDYLGGDPLPDSAMRSSEELVAISLELAECRAARLGYAAKPWIEFATKYRQEQSCRARKPRGKVTEDGETISAIIGKLALSGEQEESATELWPSLFAELDLRHLNPREKNDPKDPRRSVIEYDNAKSERKAITFGRFANIVTNYRKKKKSR